MEVRGVMGCGQGGTGGRALAGRESPELSPASSLFS